MHLGVGFKSLTRKHFLRLYKKAGYCENSPLFFESKNSSLKSAWLQ